MEVTITSAGMITNQKSGLSANPHECHEFNYQMLFTSTGNVVEHLSWELIGDYPNGISIDNIGKITGTIMPFNLQPTVTDVNPHTPLKLDGSNYMENGRYRGATYTFTFTVKHNYTIINTNTPEIVDGVPLPLLPIPESNSTELSIMVIKSANIDNFLFFKEYLDVDEELEKTLLSMNNGIVETTIQVTKRYMTYNGIQYFKDDLDELTNVHPGPFSKCGLE